MLSPVLPNYSGGVYCLLLGLAHSEYASVMQRAGKPYKQSVRIAMKKGLFILRFQVVSALQARVLRLRAGQANPHPKPQLPTVLGTTGRVSSLEEEALDAKCNLKLNHVPYENQLACETNPGALLRLRRCYVPLSQQTQVRGSVKGGEHYKESVAHKM